MRLTFNGEAQSYFDILLHSFMVLLEQYAAFRSSLWKIEDDDSQGAKS